MKKLLTLITALLCSIDSFSQADTTKIDSIIVREILSISDQFKKYIPNYSPQSPNVASSRKHGDYEVNLSTGLPDINIPIYTINEGGLSVPIMLKYHASGHKMKELASWVGWGWRAQ